MDRYVIREPRVAADYPQGNQMIHFPVNAGRNNMITSENVYYSPSGSYAHQFTNIQNAPNSSYHDVNAMNSPAFGQINMGPGQTQMVTGIDPRYLANYSDNRAQYIVTGQQMQVEPSAAPVDTGLGANYLNSNFGGADRNKVKTFIPQVLTHINSGPYTEPLKSKTLYEGTSKTPFQTQQHSQTNMLQNAINAKCVSIRSGESCAKNLVIRDDNGPAMQVVYYEIDFMLPELKLPSTVRHKVVVITGAAHGIGAQIAEDLVKIGSTVIGFEPTDEKVEEMLTRMNSWGNFEGQLIPCKCDVSKEEDVKNAFEATKATITSINEILRHEFRFLKANIKVTNIACGRIEGITEMETDDPKLQVKDVAKSEAYEDPLRKRSNASGTVSIITHDEVGGKKHRRVEEPEIEWSDLIFLPFHPVFKLFVLVAVLIKVMLYQHKLRDRLYSSRMFMTSNSKIFADFQDTRSLSVEGIFWGDPESRWRGSSVTMDFYDDQCIL
ncbi:unnamed protein product [Spodoptera littoralis]|uniref:Uncharacterized protein n=1 Tax=Spodoptera littoralis TaxID=7109 RepID=A0A9P0MYJ2_SPOLI|nr:unnamed protein product [Spodoptera littoralis]CAH1638087.1 unnamed protein product [Spodoptera littoralis]